MIPGTVHCHQVALPVEEAFGQLFDCGRSRVSGPGAVRPD